MLSDRKLPAADRMLKCARQLRFGTKTGIAAFDSQFALQGFVGLLGEPEACKSVLALQIAVHNVAKGNHVYFVDKELGEDLFTERLLCAATAMCWESWKKLTDVEFVQNYLKVVQKVPVLINHYDTERAVIIAEVKELCENAVQGQKVILILDSLQAVCGTKESMREAIDLWLEELDELKMKYRDRLTIVATVEKRRETYGSAQKSAGKESGRIEYKFEQQFDLRAQGYGEIIVECTKNRHGPRQGQVVLRKLFENETPTSFIFKLGGAR